MLTIFKYLEGYRGEEELVIRGTASSLGKLCHSANSKGLGD